MIEVELPDGSIAEFPDGTSNDIIKGALQKRFSPQAESPQSQALRADLSSMTQAASPPERGVADSVAAFGRGLIEYPTFSFADELGAGARYLGGKVLPWRDEVTYDEALREVRGEDRRQAIDNPRSTIAGNVTGALALGSGLTRAGLSPTANAISSGAGLGRVSAASALEGGILGGLTGAGQGEGLADRATQAVEGGIGGAAIGAVVPGAMQVIGSTVRRAISPFLTNPERTAAAQTLAREGVETSAGQRTGSNALRYAESEIGGQRAADLFERQGEQFTRAALSRAGVNANRATPEVIDNAFQQIGQQFDDLAARNQITPDAQLARDLGTTVREYFSLVPETARAPVVTDMVQDLGATLGQGNLDGAAYQAARSRLDRMARSASRDPQLQDALYGIRNALDDAMERSIVANNPADAGAWREVRNQYRNMLVIEKSATGAGENAAQGIISPSQLRNATVTGQGRRNYARGRGDFAELARAGEAVLKPMPNSGTAGRLNAQNLGLGLAGLLGAGAGTATGDPTNALMGAAAGFLAPRAVGATMMTPIVQALLSNQAGNAARLSPQMRAMINTLLNAGASQESPSVGRAITGR